MSGFTWTEDMLRFMADAASWGDYHQRLAAELAPWLPRKGQILDAGCGQGFLSLALAERCEAVVGADRDGRALECLESEARRRGVRNVSPWETDLLAAPPRPGAFTAMVFCFFGSVEEILRLGVQYRPQVLVMVKKAWRCHRFDAASTPLRRYTYGEACGKLEALGVPFSRRELSLEFGQPFRSLTDAETFFALYKRGEKRFTPEEIRAQLQETGRTDFPWYLPSENHLGLICVHTGDIPDEINLNCDKEKTL
jgi:SAM-dependent methyltransferase